MGGGADGFLIKTVSAEALIQSLQLVMLGEKVFVWDNRRKGDQGAPR
jgi:DNA-binding NarL/FixJ family response regulator